MNMHLSPRDPEIRAQLDRDTPDERASGGKRRTWLIVLVAALAAAAFIWFLVQKANAPKPQVPPAAPPTVTVIVPGTSLVADRVAAVGTIHARRDMPVGVAGDGGMISAIRVEAGQYVSRGQVLAEINSSVERGPVAAASGGRGAGPGGCAPCPIRTGPRERAGFPRLYLQGGYRSPHCHPRFGARPRRRGAGAGARDAGAAEPPFHPGAGSRPRAATLGGTRPDRFARLGRALPDRRRRPDGTARAGGRAGHAGPLRRPGRDHHPGRLQQPLRWQRLAAGTRDRPGKPSGRRPHCASPRHRTARAASPMSWSTARRRSVPGFHNRPC